MLEFTAGGVKATPVKMSEGGKKALQSRLMLFLTGVSRKSTTILQDQKTSIDREDRKVVENLHYLKELAIEVKRCLQEEDLPRFACLLDEGWQRKKSLSRNIANSAIDNAYEAAKAAGAEGGKITGAGGGGFMLLCCPPEKQKNVTQALQCHGYRRMNFQLEEHGAHVLLDQRYTLFAK